MKFTIMQIAAFVSSVGLIVSFQNCAPYHSTVVGNGSSSAASIDPSGTTAKVSAIMATGHMGRSLMSCDGGRTWIHDRSDNDAARCWVGGDVNYVECDHHPLAGHFVDYDSGYFYADYGWGANGTLRRSKDGVNWDVIRSGSWGQGAVRVGEKMLLTWGPWMTSEDAGATWTPAMNVPNLGHDFVLHRFGSTIITVATDGTFGRSDDVGRTWPSMATLDPTQTGGGVAVGNGRIVLTGRTAVDSHGDNSAIVTVSSDGGATWSSPITVGTGYYVNWYGPVFNGTSFVGWFGGRRWFSNDGLNWTSTALPQGLLPGPVVYHASTGTYVMVSSTWGNYYGAQKAYYSTDGVNWVTLDSSHFKGGHPINSVTVGDVDSSACASP